MSDQRPDVDALVAEVRATVDARRKDGAFPPGVEDGLDAFAARVASHRQGRSFGDLHEALTLVALSRGFGADHIHVESNVPGGDALHRAVAKAVRRQTEGVLQQVSTYANSLQLALEAVVRAIEDPDNHAHLDLVGRIDDLDDRVTGALRTTGAVDVAIAELTGRVESLERAAADRAINPWWTNDAFEDAFRGSTDQLLAHYADLADVLVGCDPVLDIGCGRGELLQLLAERGVQAAGIELDPELVRLARAEGHDVWHGDGVAHLRSLDDATLGGAVMIQVIEHLPPQLAVDVVPLLAAKVRAGGKVVVETVNPQSLYVYAHAFWLDPTHTRPIHPQLLAFLFREAGFAEVAIDWRSPTPDDDRLQTLDTGDAAVDEPVNENVERLNRLLFGPQDYAVIATR